MQSTLCYCPSVCLHVHLSIRHTGDQSKTVENWIMQLSPKSSPIPLVLWYKFNPEILMNEDRPTLPATELLHTESTFQQCIDLLILLFWPNLKSLALLIPAIIVIEVLGGVANPQSWGTGGHRGSGMVLFERVLVNS